MSITMLPAYHMTAEEMQAAENMTKEQFLAYQEEMEGIQLTFAKGEETEATSKRMGQVEAFMEVAPWVLHPDHGVIPMHDHPTPVQQVGFDPAEGLF